MVACKGKVQESAKTDLSESKYIELTPSELKIADIGVGKAQKMNISATFFANGVIDVPPQNLVSVSATLGGYLKYTKLLPGMHIRKGEQLAIMEDQQYIQIEEDYLIGKNRLGLLKTEYERQLELNRTKATSDKVLQQAESDYKSQLIAIKAFEEKLRLINISPNSLNENTLSRTITLASPIDGFVSKVNVNIGKYVTPAEIMFELVNPSDIHLNLKIYEKDLDKVYIGQHLLAWSQAKPEIKYPAEIILIGRDIGPEKFVDVHCHFSKYDNALIPGMFMNSQLEINQKEMLAIPEDAVMQEAGKSYCFLQIAEGKFEKLELTNVANENGMSSVTAADGRSLQNAVFITKNAYFLWMKMHQSNEE